MSLVSCLYECEITHARTKPHLHSFLHKHFMLYLALDEIKLLNSRMRLFGKNRLSPYHFKPEDHLPNAALSAVSSQLPELKNRVTQFVADNGIKTEIKQICLLTNVHCLGYVFNPVSFFFCFGDKNQPLCCVVEVGNTFGEKKAYILKSSNDSKFRHRLPKLFYISPFTELNHDLIFDLTLPDEQLNMKINTAAGEEQVVSTSIHGERLDFNDKNLLTLTLRYPLAPVQVIILIHFHALLLWLKGTPFHMKEDKLEQQTAVMNPHHSLKKDSQRN